MDIAWGTPCVSTEYFEQLTFEYLTEQNLFRTQDKEMNETYYILHSQHFPQMLRLSS
jgi:hypothetical protein